LHQFTHVGVSGPITATYRIHLHSTVLVSPQAHIISLHTVPLAEHFNGLVFTLSSLQETYIGVCDAVGAAYRCRLYTTFFVLPKTRVILLHASTLTEQLERFVLTLCFLPCAQIPIRHTVVPTNRLPSRRTQFTLWHTSVLRVHARPSMVDADGLDLALGPLQQTEVLVGESVVGAHRLMMCRRTSFVPSQTFVVLPLHAPSLAEHVEGLVCTLCLLQCTLIAVGLPVVPTYWFVCCR